MSFARGVTSWLPSAGPHHGLVTNGIRNDPERSPGLPRPAPPRRTPICGKDGLGESQLPPPAVRAPLRPRSHPGSRRRTVGPALPRPQRPRRWSARARRPWWAPRWRRRGPGHRWARTGTAPRPPGRPPSRPGSGPRTAPGPVRRAPQGDGRRPLPSDPRELPREPRRAPQQAPQRRDVDPGRGLRPAPPAGRGPSPLRGRLAVAAVAVGAVATAGHSLAGLDALSEAPTTAELALAADRGTTTDTESSAASAAGPRRASTRPPRTSCPSRRRPRPPPTSSTTEADSAEGPGQVSAISKAAERRAAQARAAAEAARPDFVKPAEGRFTSGFGARWGSSHRGIDIAGPIGTPIVSVADGTVVESGPASGFGMWVKVELDDGTINVYGHVNRSYVREGQQVRAGEEIAEIGNRGRSTGPHLHFEVWTDGEQQDQPAAVARRARHLAGIPTGLVRSPARRPGPRSAPRSGALVVGRVPNERRFRCFRSSERAAHVSGRAAARTPGVGVRAPRGHCQSRVDQEGPRARAGPARLAALAARRCPSAETGARGHPAPGPARGDPRRSSRAKVPFGRNRRARAASSDRAGRWWVATAS